MDINPDELSELLKLAGIGHQPQEHVPSDDMEMIDMVDVIDLDGLDGIDEPETNEIPQDGMAEPEATEIDPTQAALQLGQEELEDSVDLMGNGDMNNDGRPDLGDEIEFDSESHNHAEGDVHAMLQDIQQIQNSGMSAIDRELDINVLSKLDADRISHIHNKVMGGAEMSQDDLEEAPTDDRFRSEKSPSEFHKNADKNSPGDWQAFDHINPDELDSHGLENNPFADKVGSQEPDRFALGDPDLDQNYHDEFDADDIMMRAKRIRGEFEPDAEVEGEWRDVRHPDEVEEDSLQNGYDDKHTFDKDDFFPSGAVTNAPDTAGPASATHGDNPLAVKMKEDAVKQVHESLVYKYRDFK